MKKIISALAALAVGLGLAVVAVPLAASAHTWQVRDTCEALSVNLTNYAGIVPGTDPVPEQSHVVHHEAEYMHHDAVTKTQWKYVKIAGLGELWLDNDWA
jgi:hypothetical protein